MSDMTEHQVTDILLPAANVAIFSKDSDTLSCTNLLKDDWRFARVNINIVEGGVLNAIEEFAQNGAPDLLIIQTDDISDSFTDRLDELSEYCDEDTAAIIIGPVNDVYLYRKLIDMGVSDYLVRPVSIDIIKEVIAKTLIARLGVSDSRLIAISGSKGGVGTSYIAQICALIAANIMEQKTLLMDGAGGWSSLSVGMGFDPATTLSEVSRAVLNGNEDALGRMFFEVSERLNILTSGADSMLDPMIDAKSFEAIIDNFMVKYPVVFVDLSSCEASIKKVILARAHNIIVISTPTVTSLRFCRSLLKEISDVRGGDIEDVSLVINMVGMNKASEVGKSDISEALEFNPCAYIDYTPSLFCKYESDVKDMVSDKDFNALATAFLPILSKTISSGRPVGNMVDNNVGSGIFASLLSKIRAK